MIKNPKDFEITCKKCGSTNVEIYGTYFDGWTHKHGMVTIQCRDCKAENTAEEMDMASPVIDNECGGGY